jgi:rare lipoprotein A
MRRVRPVVLAAFGVTAIFGIALAEGSLRAWADTPAPVSADARLAAKRLDALPPVAVPKGKPRIDHSGRKEKGRASFYSRHFTHRLMADGHRMNPHADIAASRTLPLGTTAKVVNLDNGKSATVKVEDRGPFVDGRVVDLSPKIATELGMKKKGVVPVVVKPIAVPQPDGGIKLGAGAAGLPVAKIDEAKRTTKALIGDNGTETAEK